jgi:very-short-patch-repair endonuclease
MGLKFKRQKPVGRYIADFVCWERRLIIELDGGQHAEQAAYDRRRDAWLRSQGYTVLRFWNNDVMQQLEGVLEQIRCVVSPGPSPLE